jgi:hypothetical protein
VPNVFMVYSIMEDIILMVTAMRTSYVKNFSLFTFYMALNHIIVGSLAV